MAIFRRLELPTGKIIINTDNQSSIRSLGDHGKISDQIHVMQAAQVIDILRSYDIATKLHWIPAPVEVDGNKWADKKAQKATGWKV